MARTEILIVSNRFQQISLIIGHPFSEQERIVIVRRGKILRIFEHNKNGISIDLPKLPGTKMNLWTKKSNVIPPNFVRFITVYSDQKLFIGKQTECEKYIPRCVVALDANGETNILVLNMTKRNIDVKENEKVIKGSACMEETKLIQNNME